MHHTRTGLSVLHPMAPTRHTLGATAGILYSSSASLRCRVTCLLRRTFVGQTRDAQTGALTAVATELQNREILP